jgi:hypothetical protein
MQIFLYIAVAVVALAVAFVVWGVLRLRKGNAQASEAIRNLRVEDIDWLVGEGKERLASQYGIAIDLANREAAARTLDGLFVDPMKLKNAFEKDGLSWYFVLPMGAMIGEYVRVQANGAWKQDPDGPFIEIPVKEGSATCYPFHKVLKQVNSGDKGDIYAFLVASSQLSSVK